MLTICFSRFPVIEDECEPSVVIMRTDQRQRMAQETRDDNWWHVCQLGYHLEKFWEIVDASKEILPLLKHIDLRLDIIRDDDLTEVEGMRYIKASYSDGVVSVRSGDFELSWID